MMPPMESPAQAKTDSHPNHADHPKGDKTLKHRRDDVLFVHHAAAKEGETGRHQQDECAGDHHPGDVTGIVRSGLG